MQKCFGLRRTSFQAALIIIASRAESTAWQSPETVFK